MWPLLLDMTKEESVKNLRNLELEAYSHLISALRAQGPLNSDKKKLLKDTGYVLNISTERHKAEVRRAISDEKLNTIAYHITGHTESLEDWAQEGRRIVPLLPRPAPQTAYSAIADEVSEAAGQSNKLLPAPASTERKRPPSVTISQTNNGPESSKTGNFRIPDPPKMDDKKRKMASSLESSNITQHLISPKVCRIQQLYRQKSRPKMKEIHKKPEQDHTDIHPSHRMMVPNQPQTIVCSSPQYMNQKVNILQNYPYQSIKDETGVEDYAEYVKTKTADAGTVHPIISNENQAPRPKIIPNIKPNMNITVKPQSLSPAGPSTDIQQKSIKLCSGKKSITKTVSSGQKLIVVSNAQTVPSNSILQKTLQIPFVKNVSIKNFEKFKIVTSAPTPSSIQVTNVSNSNLNMKHKVVTVKTNPTNKKMIPFSQLQVLNTKALKVVPFPGKFLSKTVTASSPLYIMNTTQPLTKTTPSTQVVSTSIVQDIGIQSNQETAVYSPNNMTAVHSPNTLAEEPSLDNGRTSVLEDILKSTGVIAEAVDDYETKIAGFQITQANADNGENQEAENADGSANQVDSCNAIQQLDYTVLPIEAIDEDNHIDDTEQEDSFHHDNLEITEAEVVEGETTMIADGCEEIPQVLYHMDSSKMSDSMEHN